MRYHFIQEHRSLWPVELMCELLLVSRSGYWDFVDRPKSLQAQKRDQLAGKIQEVFTANRGLYGSPRVYRELTRQGVTCCENTVARLMQQRELIARTKRRFVVKTADSNHDCPIAPNRLQQQFQAAAPNRVWTADITYIPTQGGWLYLAVIIDLFSRKVVGWSIAEHLRAELTCQALTMALATRKPRPGLLHHSDRGVQYACREYQALLQAAAAIASMSRQGNCYDNAVTESFFGTLKQELIYWHNFATRQQAMLAIFEYLEVFYNRKRRHSSLGYLSPESFEAGLN